MTYLPSKSKPRSETQGLGEGLCTTSNSSLSLYRQGFRAQFCSDSRSTVFLYNSVPKPAQTIHGVQTLPWSNCFKMAFENDLMLKIQVTPPKMLQRAKHFQVYLKPEAVKRNALYSHASQRHHQQVN